MQNDVSHDSTILDAPLGGKVVVTNNTSAVLPTPTSQQTKVMLYEALMRYSYPDGNSTGVHVEAIHDVAGLGLRQLFRESLLHDRLPKQTHSFTPGPYYAGSTSGVSAYTHNTSKVIDTENLVEVFR